MKPITDYVGHYAILFGDNGQYITTKKIKYKDSVFYHNHKAYRFDPRCVTNYKVKRLLGTRKYYLYNVNYPEPLTLSVNKSIEFNSSVFYQILKTDFIKKINEAHKTNLLDFLTPKNVMIGAVVIGIGWYFFSGGSLV